ncbi:MAG TPA: hypothetical protein VEU28_03930 [Actinomycetota bacterium]|nr:hypothetical protein [Actinomycetota bacterium]
MAVIYQGEHEPGTFADYLVEGTFAAAVLMTALAMVGLRTVQQGFGRTTESIGFWLVVGTCLMQGVLTIASLTGIRQLEFLILPGLVFVLIGFSIYGVVTWRAEVLPRWVAVGLIGSLPLGVALGLFGGNVLVGIFWLALAGLLLRISAVRGRSRSEDAP